MCFSWDGWIRICIFRLQVFSMEYLLQDFGGVWYVSDEVIGCFVCLCVFDGDMQNDRGFSK